MKTKWAVLIMLCASSVSAWADSSWQTVIGVNPSPQMECRPIMPHHPPKKKKKKPAPKPEAKPEVKEVVKEVIKEVQVTKEVIVVQKEQSNKNAISLVGLISPTGVRLTRTPTTATISNSYQADVGLMYQRDVKENVRFSIAGTVRGTGFLGIGLTF